MRFGGSWGDRGWGCSGLRDGDHGWAVGVGKESTGMAFRGCEKVDTPPICLKFWR